MQFHSPSQLIHSRIHTHPTDVYKESDDEESDKEEEKEGKKLPMSAEIAELRKEIAMLKALVTEKKKKMSLAAQKRVGDLKTTKNGVDATKTAAVKTEGARGRDEDEDKDSRAGGGEGGGGGGGKQEHAGESANIAAPLSPAEERRRQRLAAALRRQSSQGGGEM